MNIHPTLVDLYADFDYVFSALCPSQFFWLKATVIQLAKYSKAFSTFQSDESGVSTESEKNMNLVIEVSPLSPHLSLGSV